MKNLWPPWLMTGMILAMFLARCPVSAVAAPPVQYTIADLGPSQVVTIAPTDPTVVGSQVVGRQQTAFVLSPTTTNLGYLPQGNFSRANGAYGPAVVGYSSTGPFALYTHAFRWTAAAGMQDLGTTGAVDLFSAATGINGAGTIVGYADSPDRATIVPVVWIEGQVSLLPTLSTDNAYADAINANGDIVGDASTANGETHAVLWPVSGGVVDLHTTSGTFSLALGINNVGQVVGYASTASGARGFVWLPLTGMLTLDPLPGDEDSYAYAINDAGVIVGQSVLPDPVLEQETTQAVRWDNGVPTALLTLVTNGDGWELSTAVGVNQAGVIVGTGALNGQTRGYMLTPDPPLAADPPDDPPAHKYHHKHRHTTLVRFGR